MEIKPGPTPVSVFVWHVSSDSEIGDRFSQALRNCGLEVHTSTHCKKPESGSMDVSSWQMNICKCILFILSEKSITNQALSNDVDRIMRRKDVLVVPILIEDISKKDLPFLLRLITAYKVKKNFSELAEQLTEDIRRKFCGKPSKIMRPSHFWYYPAWWVMNHYRHYLALSPLTFCWQITVENLIMSMTVTGLIIIFLQPETRSNLDNISASQFFWLVIILSPLLETLFLQFIPVNIAKKIGLNRLGQIIFSTIPFSILHFSRSVGAGIGAGIIGGFYSSFTFVHWDQKSTKTAFWVTALSHCLYNMAIFAMIIGDY